MGKLTQLDVVGHILHVACHSAHIAPEPVTRELAGAVGDGAAGGRGGG
jgi:hypothetical protein